MMMEFLSFMVLWGISAAGVGVQGQYNTQGYISIDCGIPEGSSYTDEITKIPYTSDGQYIDSGTNKNIANSITSSLPKQFSTLRSFPNGSFDRNCYTLKPATKNFKYLLRASFAHGNYDGELMDKPILFDLHLGTNLWKGMNISNASAVYTTEAVTVAEFDFISVCLVNTKAGTPFISSLELRPLKMSIYQALNFSRALVLYRRLNVGAPEDQIVRYPDDPYDRIWEPFTEPDWTPISTKEKVANPTDPCDVPSAVLQTAAISSSSATSLQYNWTAAAERDGTLSQYLFFLSFAEIQSGSLAENKSRTFDVYLDGFLFSGPFTPYYLSAGQIFTIRPDNHYQYNISIEAEKTVPPILNALEIYSAMRVTDVSTDGGDVDAIMAIKEHYQLKRNWMGDPCMPRRFAWDGMTCSYMVSAPPRIIVLNLSSSGLTGGIPSSLANLKAIEFLDLSYNELNGTIPDFLAELSSLQVLNLTGNQLNGQIPSVLLKRSDDGSLTLSIEGNLGLCKDEGSCERKKHTDDIAVIPLAVLSVVAGLLLLVVVSLVLKMRRRKQALGPQTDGYPGQLMGNREVSVQAECRQFTFAQLENITNGFQKEIGRGGFGTVYHGCLENGSEVAVKVHSVSSSQGNTEFMTEAQVLTRIHHRYLVPLVGYCRDGNHLVLVYEYMTQGSLEEHLKGKEGGVRILRWGERLRIALEAAQGLEYLHNGCKPPIIHRDVKTSNILLNDKLEAMIADFGLSKAFHKENLTHVSTRVVGTVGYLDPEYYRTFQLTEKSDIYSFGVVLLELITGRPAVMSIPEQCHISEWVHKRLARGDIADLVDSRLEVEFDNSIWKAADIAMKCTAAVNSQRPPMAYVVAQLKEALALETTQGRSQVLSMEAIDASESRSFEMDSGGMTTIVAR